MSKPTNSLDDLFESTPPPINTAHKEAAIEQATEKFSQGFESSARLSNEPTNQGWSLADFLRRLFMTPIQQKWAYGAFGVLAVATITLSLFGDFSLDKQPVVTLTQEPQKSVIEPTLPTEPEPEATAEAIASAEKNTISEAEARKLVQESIRQEDQVIREQLKRIEANKKKQTEERIQPEPETIEQQLEAEKVARREIELPEEFKENELSTTLSQAKKTLSDQPEGLEEITVTANKAESAPISTEQDQVWGTGLGTGELAALRHAQPSVAPIYEEIIVTGNSPKARSINPDFVSPAPQRPDANEDYAAYKKNEITLVSEQPVSTFSVDVDSASYSLVRNQLNSGLLPRPQAIRAEEFINYFDYDYPLPENQSAPFAANVNVFDSPWNKGRQLIHIGIQGYDLDSKQQPDSNLVFLLDVSGSMGQPNKLPLVKQSMSLLLESLKPSDTVSIVVYAGAAGTVLEPTHAKDKNKILDALRNLQAGGSTAGAQGLNLAYQLAEQNFLADGVNRIILATDGDFNVGQQSNEDLKTLVERKRDKGIFLSVLGFGRNNYQDDMMQTLAQNGNGIAAYIDTLSEAKKVLLDEATSALFTIAKDVKLQVEFNPARVADYRLVGYETRILERQDFNNDKVDAGEIGAGHSVTAIYEITPVDSPNKSVDVLRYQSEEKSANSKSKELGYLKIRYKLPDEDQSKLIEIAIKNQESNSSEAQFAAAVAGFAQLLSNSKHTGKLDYDQVIALAQKHKGDDEFGYRSEFIQLVRIAKVAQP